MSAYMTSSSLINQVKTIGLVPSSQSTFSDADFLSMANTEIKIGMLPSILQYHEEFYARDTAPISLVANQSNYPIPYRAVGGKFRNLFYRDTNGNLRQMSRISPDDRAQYQTSTYSSDCLYFYIQGNDIVLVPSIGDNPTGSLVFSYYMRPNELVDEDRVAKILSISEGASTTVFTVDQIPASLTAFYQGGNSITGFTSANAKFDILQENPGHKTIVFDITPTAVSSGALTITFDNDDLDDSIVAGDYICFASECIIPQIPTELHDVLAQRVLMRTQQALGDTQGYTVGQAKLSEMEKNTGTLVDNRSEGSATKATNKNSHLRSSRFRRGW